MNNVKELDPTKLTKKQERECRNAFEIWNKDTLRMHQWELFKGWKACYTWFVAKKQKEFDETLDEMYNSYRQDNPKEGL